VFLRRKIARVDVTLPNTYRFTAIANRQSNADLLFEALAVIGIKNRQLCQVGPYASASWPLLDGDSPERIELESVPGASQVDAKLRSAYVALLGKRKKWLGIPEHAGWPVTRSAVVSLATTAQPTT
jgi:hypothetical protein